jgi:hypothetical protein
VLLVTKTMRLGIIDNKDFLHMNKILRLYSFVVLFATREFR